MSEPKKNNSAIIGLLTVEAAISFGGELFVDSTKDFNDTFDHIVALLNDATFLFERSSFATSAFLSITAMEETAKARVGLHRREPQTVQRGRDPLRDHRAKHRMAILPTVLMGPRLHEALGAEACERLAREAAETGFTVTREAALYVGRQANEFLTPQRSIPPERARELLLLAIEAADDALVGYTNHSMIAGDDLLRLFEKFRHVTK